jgi:hypothetical protein
MDNGSKEHRSDRDGKKTNKVLAAIGFLLILSGAFYWASWLRHAWIVSPVTPEGDEFPMDQIVLGLPFLLIGFLVLRKSTDRKSRLWTASVLGLAAMILIVLGIGVTLGFHQLAEDHRNLASTVHLEQTTGQASMPQGPAANQMINPPKDSQIRHEMSTPEGSTGPQFKDWGISLTPPAQWQRWSSDKESAAATQALQSSDDATLKVKLIHLAAWSIADEAAFMVLTVLRERSGAVLQLSDVFARNERDDKRAKANGDATQVNRLEIGEAAGRACVVNDVTLRAGGRMLTYDFVSGPEQVEIQWLFRDASRFVQFKPAIDGILKSLSLKVDQSDVPATGAADKPRK